MHTHIQSMHACLRGRGGSSRERGEALEGSAVKAAEVVSVQLEQTALGVSVLEARGGGRKWQLYFSIAQMRR